MREYVPVEWFDKKAERVNFFLIAELGLLAPIARAAVLDQMSGNMWPLVNDDTQLHLVSEGPWLFQLDLDRLDLPDIAPLLEVGLAWIAAYPEGQELSRQFAPALCCISPSREAAFLRFYCPEIVGILKSHVGEPWFDRLFAKLLSWHWMQESGEFRAVFKSALTKPRDDSGDWVLEVDDQLWLQLAGNPEIEVLINCLNREAPEVVSRMSGAEKRKTVCDCLTTAEKLGIEKSDDRRAFVYLKMAAGNDEAFSKEISTLALKAVRLQIPLVELLETEAG